MKFENEAYRLLKLIFGVIVLIVQFHNMSPIDNINSGMENLTLIGLRKFNLSGQEFDITNFPKFVEFEPDNSTKTGNQSINVSK